MDVQKIGEALGVQSILTGRVAQRGDDLTIGVELDDVRNGTQLWGQQYNRKLADLLAVQNDIAREVSQRLRSQLSAPVSLGLVFMSPDFFPHAAATLEILRVHGRIPLLAGCSGAGLIVGAEEMESARMACA